MQRMRVIGLVATWCAIGLLGCGEDSSNQDQEPDVPTIDHFTATPDQIVAGEEVTLDWAVTGALVVNIEPGLADQPLTGSQTMALLETTTYVLTAINDGGQVQEEVTVQVDPAPPAIVSFTSSTGTPTCGDEVTLSWETTEADSVVITSDRDDRWEVGVTGSRTVSPHQDTTYTLTATGPGGEVTWQLAIPVQPRVPDIDLFTANPVQANSDTPVTLTWETTCAHAISLRYHGGDYLPGLEESDQLSGQVEVTIGETTTFLLEATSGEDLAQAEMVTVTVSPRIDLFDASATVIKNGEVITLQWQTVDATGVTIYANEEVLPLPFDRVNGTFEDRPTVDTTYRLRATGPGGATEEMVTVTVHPYPRIEYFTVDRTAVGPTGNVTLSWEVGGTATMVTLTANGATQDVGGGTLAGTFSMVPGEDYPVGQPVSFQLTATGPEGAAAGTAEVRVYPSVVIANFTVTPGSIESGEAATLAWETTGADQVDVAIDTTTIAPDVGSVGTLAVYPATTTRYTLVAYNPALEERATVDVQVDAPLIDSFTATPPTIHAGDTTTLAWSTRRTDTVTIVPPLEGFAARTVAGNFIDISATGTAAPNMADRTDYMDATEGVAIGFDFPFLGQVYDTVYASANGFFSFLPLTDQYDNEQATIPTATLPNAYVAPFWTLMTGSVQGDERLYYETRGAAPNRMFIIQWTHYHQFGHNAESDLTFQAILYESGTVEFQYGAMVNTDDPGEAQGDEATVGLENRDGSAGVLFSFQSPSISPNTGILFASPTYGSTDTVQVVPTGDTVYTLVAEGPGGTTTATVAVGLLPGIDSFDVDQTSINNGDPVTLSWQVIDTASVAVTANDQPLPIVATEVSGTYVDRPEQTTTYRLTATNRNGETTRTHLVTVVPYPRIDLFAADRATVDWQAGTPVTLSWDVRGTATGVALTANGADLGIDPTGLVDSVTHTPTRTTDYILSASGPEGTASATVTVTMVYPDVVITSFTADPTVVPPNGSTTLQWQTTGAGNVDIRTPAGVVATALPPQGSYAVAPQEIITTYTLIARNPEKEAQQSLDVMVNPPTLTSLTTSQPVIVAGSTTDISWTADQPGQVYIQSLGMPVTTIPDGSGFIDIRSTGTRSSILGDDTNGDGLEAGIQLGFTFPFLGGQYTQLTASDEGWLGFDAAYPASDEGNDSIPNATLPNNIVAPFWDALAPKDATAGFFYETRGTAPNRSFIAQWYHYEYDYSSYTTELNFEAILYENGTVEFHYQEMSGTDANSVNRAHGGYATIGLENADGTAGILWSYNTESLTPPMGIRFGFPAFNSTDTVTVAPTENTDYRICVVGGDCLTTTIQVIHADDLVVSEVMALPGSGLVDDEWFELKNRTDRAIDLQGWVVQTVAGSHTIAAPFTVPAGGHAVIARSPTTGGSGAYIDSTLDINAQQDAISLSFQGAPVTQQSFGTAIGWPVQSGASTSLVDLQEGNHGDAAYWCPSSFTIMASGTDYGTPGTINDPCVQGDRCYRPIPITFNGSNVATLTGATTLFVTNSDEGRCGDTTPGPEIFYELTLTERKHVRVDLDSSGSANSFDSVTYLTEATCGGATLMCSDNTTSNGSEASWVDAVLESGTYLVVVDGDSETEYGDYTLTVTLDSAPAYRKEIIAANFLDISATGTAVPDLNAHSAYVNDLPIGFVFPFFSGTYQLVNASTEGFLSFDILSNYHATNEPIPDSGTPNNLVAPLWDSLYQQDELDPIPTMFYYQTMGTAPNRKFIAQWDHYSFTSSLPHGDLVFQAILHENGDIEFHYQALDFPNDPVRATGDGATVGIESTFDANNQVTGYPHSFDMVDAVSTSVGIRFIKL